MIGARLVHPSLALGREYLELLRETDRVDIGWVSPLAYILAREKGGAEYRAPAPPHLCHLILFERSRRGEEREVRIALSLVVHRDAVRNPGERTDDQRGVSHVDRVVRRRSSSAVHVRDDSRSCAFDGEIRSARAMARVDI